MICVRLFEQTKQHNSTNWHSLALIGVMTGSKVKRSKSEITGMKNRYAMKRKTSSFGKKTIVKRLLKHLLALVAAPTSRCAWLTKRWWYKTSRVMTARFRFFSLRVFASVDTSPAPEKNRGLPQVNL